MKTLKVLVRLLLLIKDLSTKGTQTAKLSANFQKDGTYFGVFVCIIIIIIYLFY